MRDVCISALPRKCSDDLGKIGKRRYLCKKTFIAQVQMGPVIRGAALPIIDPNDVENVETGILARILAEMPEVDEPLMAEFLDFAASELKRRIIPIDEKNVLTFEECMEEWAGHTQEEKINMRQEYSKYDSLDDLLDVDPCNEVKAFVKYQAELSYKRARMILPRCEAFRAHYMRYIHTIERRVYKWEETVKGLTPREKMEELERYFNNKLGLFLESDYTRFEASYTKSHLRIEYMLLCFFFPWAKQTWKRVYKMLCGKQVCKSKLVDFWVIGRRMSGEMTTSLVHFVMNLLVHLFIAKKLNVHIKGKFEGDDNVSEVSRVFKTDIYRRLGLIVKMSFVNSLYDASFCHVMYSHSGALVRDPREVLMKLGWSLSNRRLTHKSVVRLGLLKAKCLSYYYELPNCPIVAVITYKILQLTCTVVPIIELDGYHVLPDNILVTKPEIPADAYSYVEQHFGLSTKMQQDIENEIYCWNEIPKYYPVEWNGWLLSHPNSADWVDYFLKYALPFNDTC